MMGNVGQGGRDLDPRVDESEDDESELYDSEKIKTPIKGHLYQTRIVNRDKQGRRGSEAQSACKYSPQNENDLIVHRTTEEYEKSLIETHVFSSDGISSDGSNDSKHFEHIYYTAEDELGNESYEKPRSPSSKDKCRMRDNEGNALAANSSPSLKEQPTSPSASQTASLGTVTEENTPLALSGNSTVQCKQGERHFSSDEESTQTRVKKDPNYENMSPLPSSSSGDDCDNSESHNVLHTYYSVDDLS